MIHTAWCTLGFPAPFSSQTCNSKIMSTGPRKPIAEHDTFKDVRNLNHSPLKLPDPSLPAEYSMPISDPVALGRWDCTANILLQVIKVNPKLLSTYP